MSVYLKRCFVLTAFTLTLNACVSISNTQKVSVERSDPDRIRFSGKGSAAGVMLMGAMGPVGIAIGAAIDEGIAKEIEGAANAVGFDFYLSLRNLISKNDACGVSSVKVNRYGFKMLPGASEIVTPDLDLVFSYLDLQSRSLSYPQKEKFTVFSAPLNKLKKDGSLSAELLNKALNELAASVCETYVVKR